jgi:hypothetical protein
VRSHAKAATAGSTMRQANGLGRFFRGTSAERAASAGAKGSGTPSHRRGPLLALATALATAALCLGASFASAAPVGFEFLGAFGPDGTSLTEFEEAGSVAVDHEADMVYVLDRGADALFKFDVEGNPVDFGGSSPDVSGNELSGLAIGGILGERQVAVNSDTHTIYLTGGEVAAKATTLQAFQSNGDPALFTAGPGKGTNEITGFSNLRGVTVDVNGDIYVSGTETDGGDNDDISIYSPNGELIVPNVDINQPANIAVDTNGALYVLVNFGEVKKYTPSEFPVTPATTYTVSPERVDPRSGRSVAVDPLTNQLYVVEEFEEEGSRVAQVAIFDEEGAPEGIFAGPGEPGELERPDGIAVANVGEFGGDGDIAKPFVATNPLGGLAQVEMFKEEIVVAAPSVESTAADKVTGDSATLRAKVNPNNRDTSYWFEYGLEDCASATSPCTQVPLAPAAIGAGRKGVIVTQPIVGLATKATYHYRVVAENVVDTSEGPDQTFITQGSGIGFALSDARVWELVSPADKLSGSVLVDETAIIQASATGDGLAYASLGSIVAEPQSSRSPQPATVLGKRGAGGEWASRDLSPPHTEATQVTGDTEFKLFTSDLLRGVVNQTDETPLSPEASEQTPYLWSDGEPPLFDPLVNPTNVAPGIEFGPSSGKTTAGIPISIEGASPDLSHVVIQSDIPLVEGAAVNAVYLGSGGELEAVSELPGSEGGAIVEGMLGSGRGSVRHAISSDGSRAFWTPTSFYTASGIALPAFYLRDTVAGESVRLDVVQSGAGGGIANPAFNIASADGSVVFFTDTQQLTEDASPSGRDLYRCEIGQVEGSLGCAELTDISAPLEGSGESAEVLDQVPGASEDGTRLYFVARGALDEVPNEAGEVAEPGQPNLYFWQEGEGTRFIATLSERDEAAWGAVNAPQGYAVSITAAASPNGRFFAFPSERSLTAAENRNDSDEPTTQAFLYDAETGQLTCVSCNPSGAAPVGERLPFKVNFPPDPARLWVKRWVAATLPEAPETEGQGRSLYHPRTVLDNGRAFFNSVDPLVPADSNGNWDVYQYQPLGVGGCSEGTSGAAVARSGNGCVGLISSGTSEGDAGFLDTTPSGSDVFFVTRGRLSALDFDDETDVYDARVNGIAAQLPSRPECQGEACQPPALAPDNPTPASTAFEGAGNVKPNARKRCPKAKHRVRQGGKVRCVARKSNHRRANRNRRAAR